MVHKKPGKHDRYPVPSKETDEPVDASGAGHSIVSKVESLGSKVAEAFSSTFQSKPAETLDVPKPLADVAPHKGGDKHQHKKFDKFKKGN